MTSTCGQSDNLTKHKQSIAQANKLEGARKSAHLRQVKQFKRCDYNYS